MPDRPKVPEVTVDQYYDQDGNPCSLEVLCMREPAWATNRIRALTEQLVDALEAIAEAERRGAEAERGGEKWVWLLEAARDVLFANENIVRGLTREQAENAALATLKEAVDRFPHPCGKTELPAPPESR